MQSRFIDKARLQEAFNKNSGFIKKGRAGILESALGELESELFQSTSRVHYRVVFDSQNSEFLERGSNVKACIEKGNINNLLNFSSLFCLASMNRPDFIGLEAIHFDSDDEVRDFERIQVVFQQFKETIGSIKKMNFKNGIAHQIKNALLQLFPFVQKYPHVGAFAYIHSICLFFDKNYSLSNKEASRGIVLLGQLVKHDLLIDILKLVQEKTRRFLTANSSDNSSGISVGRYLILKGVDSQDVGFDPQENIENVLNTAEIFTNKDFVKVQTLDIYRESVWPNKISTTKNDIVVIYAHGMADANILDSLDVSLEGTYSLVKFRTVSGSFTVNPKVVLLLNCNTPKEEAQAFNTSVIANTNPVFLVYQYCLTYALAFTYLVCPDVEKNFYLAATLTGIFTSESNTMYLLNKRPRRIP